MASYGASQIYSSGGHDSIDGGVGTNTALFSSVAKAVYVDLEGVPGTNPIDPLHALGRGQDRLLNIQNVVGSSRADAFFGNSEDNVFEGGIGADYLNGRLGDDTASYTTATSGVVASLAAGSGSAGNANGDTFVSIENLEGSNFGDSLTGDTGANLLIGGAGTDTLRGGSSNDTLEGGIGADVLNGGGGSNVAAYETAGSGVVANLTNTGDNTGNADGDTYIDIIDLIGSNFNDRLVGDMQSNFLFGRGGNDALLV